MNRKPNRGLLNYFKSMEVISEKDSIVEKRIKGECTDEDY
jgi:hypothetical protein